MKTSDETIRELQDACGYDEAPEDDDPEYEDKTSVDSLIAYKNALESAYAQLLDATEPAGTSITWSGEASEGFADRMVYMAGWYVKLTTQDRETIEASIVSSGQGVEIDGMTWYDAVTYLPVDEDGIALADAEPRTVRVYDVYVY